MDKQQEIKEEGFLAKIWGKFNFFGIFGTSKNGKPLSPEEIAALDQTEQGKKMAAAIKGLLAPTAEATQEADNQTTQPNPITAEATNPNNSDMNKEDIAKMIEEANASLRAEIAELRTKNEAIEAAKQAAEAKAAEATKQAEAATKQAAETKAKLESQEQRQEQSELDGEINAAVVKNKKADNSPIPARASEDKGGISLTIDGLTVEIKGELPTSRIIKEATEEIVELHQNLKG